MEKTKKRSYSSGSLLATALLVGFIGFSLGFNWDLVSSRWQGNQQLPANLDYSEVEAVYDQLRQQYAGELKANELLEGAKRGLVEATGDPNTNYLSDQQAKEFEGDLDGTFSGIGAEIAIRNEKLVIVAPLSGSPAKAAGLAAGDHILSINGESSEDMDVETAVSKIRGEQGTQVTLQIARGNGEPKDYVITRDIIQVPSVRGELKPGGIGYIEISRFGDDTTSAFRTQAQSLRAQGATKMIIDVRNNPGGLLNSAVEISDEFLGESKTIVEERKDDKVVDKFSAKEGGSLVGLNTIVLINKGSASASEIIAGALRDNNAAKLVGEQTFGKGSVQELVDLPGEGFLKVTVALWYTPAGRNISQEGIAPDEKVELKTDDLNNNRDPQLDRALQLLSQ
jgi:carboxyl-terminal processing protease